jgi:hypothetical protein
MGPLIPHSLNFVIVCMMRILITGRLFAIPMMHVLVALLGSLVLCLDSALYFLRGSAKPNHKSTEECRIAVVHSFTFTGLWDYMDPFSFCFE